MQYQDHCHVATGVAHRDYRAFRRQATVRCSLSTTSSAIKLAPTSPRTSPTRSRQLHAFRAIVQIWYDTTHIEKLVELSNGLFIFASMAVAFVLGKNNPEGRAERLEMLISNFKAVNQNNGRPRQHVLIHPGRCGPKAGGSRERAVATSAH